MGNIFSIKKNNKSIVVKIVITCLLACGATFLSLYISRFTFKRILSTVDQLSKPNTKIQLVNDLFRNVVELDQLQRHQALKEVPTQYNPFLKESRHLQMMLDSLRGMSLENKTQVVRIDSMKKILYERDLLFLRYIKLHGALVKNDTLATEIKNLSGLIETARSHIDSNLITTSRATKTVIDTLNPEEEKQTLWNRIFSRKKPQARQVQRQVQEELNVRIDTVKIGSSGDSLTKLGMAITKVESNRIARRDLLMKKQAELNRVGDMLIAQLISILKDIEAGEVARAAAKNTMANRLVDNSMNNITIVLVLFVLATVVLVVFIFSDIAQSNRYRRQLIIARDEAEEAGLVKQRFLANMSHELRTPLQTIIGIAEQVKNNPHPKAQDLQNIYQSSHYLLQIVNEVLDYSRIISGKYTLEYKPFNMYTLLMEVKEMISVQLDIKQLTLNYNIQISPDNYYSGDSFRLKQILLNLLGNAVKFTDHGSVSLSVSETTQADNTSVFTIIVADTGSGIKEAELMQVFNQFEQGSNVHKRSGTGLGLSIVKSLVDLHDGTIALDSIIGEGTQFTVTLPFRKADNVVTNPVAYVPVKNGYQGHVWVVDDDTFILQLCHTILDKYHIAHTCFSSVEEVLQTPFPQDITVVLMDIRMPVIDGIALCSMLRERNVATQPVYIALTAQALPDEQDAILNKGFDALVMKPFLEQDLLNAIYMYERVPQKDTAEVLLDLSSVHKMVGDDKEMLQDSLHSFLIETEKDIAAMKESLESKDSQMLADIFHKLAGRFGQLGITQFTDELRSREIALRNGQGIEDALMDINDILGKLYSVTDAIRLAAR